MFLLKNTGTLAGEVETRQKADGKYAIGKGSISGGDSTQSVYRNEPIYNTTLTSRFF
jgi:hypothetical protein